MKHIPLLLFLLFGIFTTMHSQEINFGVKGGLNHSNYIGDFTEGLKPRISFHAGVFAEIPIKGKFSFHPELLYSSQGYRIDLSELNIINFNDPLLGNSLGTESVNLDYIQLPLITRLNFNDKFALELGPQIGLKVSEGSSFDYGPTLGFGFDPITKLKIQVRYYLGLSDLFRESRLGNNTINDDQFHSVFQLSAGYVIF